MILVLLERYLIFEMPLTVSQNVTPTGIAEQSLVIVNLIYILFSYLFLFI